MDDCDPRDLVDQHVRKDSPETTDMHGTEPSLDPVSSAFVMTVQLMQAGRASLLLRRNGEPVLTIAASVGIMPSVVPSIEVFVGRGIAGIVAERGMVLLGSVADQTFVSTPVVTERGIEGVLNLTERLGGRPFTSRDIASSNALATHIARLLEYRRRAAVDVVSGLPNRRAFEEMLERELARSERTQGSFSVVFLDVDGLKQVNDEFGHAAGDALIRSVGHALRNAIRPYDFAARYGGDEFALILADTYDSEKRIASRISGASSAAAGPGAPGYTISIGLARFPSDGKTAETLVAVADSRMYEYKQARPARTHIPRTASR
jgi:diguanylate cyclase (GGDEF)-like protein